MFSSSLWRQEINIREPYQTLITETSDLVILCLLCWLRAKKQRHETQTLFAGPCLGTSAHHPKTRGATQRAARTEAGRRGRGRGCRRRAKGEPRARIAEKGAGRKNVKPQSPAKRLALLPAAVLQNLINEQTSAASHPLKNIHKNTLPFMQKKKKTNKKKLIKKITTSQAGGKAAGDRSGSSRHSRRGLQWDGCARAAGQRDPRRGFLRRRKSSGAHPAPLGAGSAGRAGQPTENSPPAKPSLPPPPRCPQPSAPRRPPTTLLQAQGHGERHPWAQGTERQAQQPWRTSQPRLSSFLTPSAVPRYSSCHHHRDRAQCLGTDQGMTWALTHLRGPRARDGACLSPAVNTASPKPFGCERTPSKHPASSPRPSWVRHPARSSRRAEAVQTRTRSHLRPGADSQGAAPDQDPQLFPETLPGLGASRPL